MKISFIQALLVIFTTKRVSAYGLLIILLHAGYVNAGHGRVATQSSDSLSFLNAYVKVLENDFALIRSDIEAQRFASEASSKNVLPDPTFFASMQNLPTDTFDLDQEAMTQLRVGVRQMFPKGNSLALNESIVLASQSMEGIKKTQRRLSLREQTQEIWLEAWYWQRFKAVIEHDRVFLTQMQDFIQSLYQLGSNNQSDLIGAKLELIKLDEKLLDADKNYEFFRHQLDTLANTRFAHKHLSPELLALLVPTLPEQGALFALLKQHPEIQLLELNIAQLNDKVALAEQDTKPQWGIELSYGMRQGDNLNGSSRPDLLTAGLNVQVPLFSGQQKKQSVNALRYQQDAFENVRLERLNKIRFELENLAQQYRNTQAQTQLFETQILPTLSKQKDSALQSYESDKGDFGVVTNLYLQEQATRIKLQRLRVNEQLILSKMHYWLVTDSSILATQHTLSNPTPDLPVENKP